MSIVKMRRLRLIAMREDRDALLKDIQRLGCLEIDEPAGDEVQAGWNRLDNAALERLRGQAELVNDAVKLLNESVPTKGGLFHVRPEVTEGQLFDEEALRSALSAAEEIRAVNSRLGEIRSRQSALKAQTLTLAPWQAVDRPLEHLSTETMAVVPGTVPAAVSWQSVEEALEEKAPLAAAQWVDGDQTFHYLLLMYHRSAEEEALDAMKPFSFTRADLKGWSDTPKEESDRLNRQAASLEEEWQREHETLMALGEKRDDLKLVLDRLNQEIRREEAKERLLAEEHALFLEGWATAPAEEELKRVLDKYGCAYEFSDPEDPEEVPVQLKSNKLTYPLNMVTEMYSLPAYDGIDPNPLILPFFSIFFGIMYADLGYGIILMILGLAALKFLKPKGMIRQMMGLMVICGVTTAVAGFFFGSFFGDVISVIFTSFLGIPESQFPAWLTWFNNGPLFNPMNEPMKMLILSLALGAIQIVTSQCIHIYMGFREKNGLDAVLDVVPWWVFFAGLAVTVLKGGYTGLIVGLLALVLTQGRHEKNLFLKLFGGIKSIYGVTNYLSDILSYLRLMALVLATAVIASVVNLLGAMTGIIGFIVIFLIGHGFNMSVNIIGTYVHAARLQYLEYFSRFYKEGGRPFAPLKIDTDYVDLVKEE